MNNSELPIPSKDVPQECQFCELEIKFERSYWRTVYNNSGLCRKGVGAVHRPKDVLRDDPISPVPPSEGFAITIRIETKGGQRKTYGCDTQEEANAILDDMSLGDTLISCSGTPAPSEGLIKEAEETMNRCSACGEVIKHFGQICQMGSYCYKKSLAPVEATGSETPTFDEWWADNGPSGSNLLFKGGKEYLYTYTRNMCNHAWDAAKLSPPSKTKGTK